MGGGNGSRREEGLGLGLAGARRQLVVQAPRARAGLSLPQDPGPRPPGPRARNDGARQPKPNEFAEPFPLPLRRLSTSMPGPSPVRPAWLCGRQRAPEALSLQGQCPPSIIPTVTAPLADAGAAPPPRGTTDPRGTAMVAASPRSRPGAPPDPSLVQPGSQRMTSGGQASFGGGGWVVARLQKN